MTTLPEYLTEKTEDAILQDMLDSVPDDIDKTEGSYVWDPLSAAAIKFALSAIDAQEVLSRGFASTTFGDYLTERAKEHGVIRIAAVKATGMVTFTGAAATVVPVGTQVSTEADELTSTEAVEFVTTQEVTIAGGGTIDAPIEAMVAGVDGIVGSGKIIVMVTPVAGVTAVSNAAQTANGADEESDEDLLDRYLTKVRNPSAGGNKADYINWAKEVSGVGDVRVVPVKYGNGTVSVAIIDTNKQPASATLRDTVQNYIAPPWEFTKQAENMTLGGAGTSTDNTLADDDGTSVKFAVAAGASTLYHTDIETLLVHPTTAAALAGIWRIKPRMKVDSIAGGTDLVTIGMYNVTTAGWCKTTPGGSTDATKTFKPSDLSATFDDSDEVEFYWNGTDNIELRITRLDAENATILWIDKVLYRSAFSKDTGEVKAPIGARVSVEIAASVTINVSATLVLANGYTLGGVQTSVGNSIAAYLKDIAYTDDNDPRYAKIANAILDTVGIVDYSNLTVNGGTSNIAVAEQDVAVLGTVTLS